MNTLGLHYMCPFTWLHARLLSLKILNDVSGSQLRLIQLWWYSITACKIFKCRILWIILIHCIIENFIFRSTGSPQCFEEFIDALQQCWLLNLDMMLWVFFGNVLTAFIIVHTSTLLYRFTEGFLTLCFYYFWTQLFNTGFALNKTFSHHMKKVIFFSNLDQSNQNVPGAQQITLILHPTSNPSQFLHKTLEYLYDKFRFDLIV